MSIERPIGRLITRMIDAHDGLIIGSAYKTGRRVWKPNSIYEITTCPLSDDIYLRYMGPSMVGRGQGEPISQSPIGASWAMKYEEVMNIGAEVILTPVEYLGVLQGRLTTALNPATIDHETAEYLIDRIEHLKQFIAKGNTA